jgi:uncharacterized protein YjdB
MRTSAQVLSALVILASAGACDSEPIGPVTSGGSMTVAPSRATIGAGQTIQLTAKLVDEFGDPLQAAVAWSSSNPEVATVSVSGTVIGRREGRTAIIASAGGQAQSAAVQVLLDESAGKPKPPL